MARAIISNTIIVLILLMTAASGRAGGAPLLSLGKNDNGRQVQLQPGQKMDVVLFENSTTGYQWRIVSVDGNVLEETVKPDFKPASGLLGAGGKKTFHFRAGAKGKTVLRLAYRRPWEANVPPIKTFAVWITVRQVRHATYGSTGFPVDIPRTKSPRRKPGSSDFSFNGYFHIDHADKD